MTQESRVDKLLFLNVLTLAIVDELDEEVDKFKFKHKRLAKAYFDEFLKLSDTTYTAEELNELTLNSQWLREIYKIMLKVGRMDDNDQISFQHDWELLLEKYGL